MTEDALIRMTTAIGMLCEGTEVREKERGKLLFASFSFVFSCASPKCRPSLVVSVGMVRYFSATAAALFERWPVVSSLSPTRFLGD